MALWIRDANNESVDGLIHHSDAGSQYTSILYHRRLADAGALASIGTVGDSYDNALAESAIGLYKTECVQHDGPFRTVYELELATCSWVHWFNHNRTAQLDWLQHTHRVRKRLLPSTTPTSTSCRENQPPLNPGRFSVSPVQADLF